MILKRIVLIILVIFTCATQIKASIELLSQEYRVELWVQAGSDEDEAYAQSDQLELFSGSIAVFAQDGLVRVDSGMDYYCGYTSDYLRVSTYYQSCSLFTVPHYEIPVRAVSDSFFSVKFLVTDPITARLDLWVGNESHGLWDGVIQLIDTASMEVLYDLFTGDEIILTPGSYELHGDITTYYGRDWSAFDIHQETHVVAALEVTGSLTPKPGSVIPEPNTLLVWSGLIFCGLTFARCRMMRTTDG